VQPSSLAEASGETSRWMPRQWPPVPPRLLRLTRARRAWIRPAA